MNTWLGTYSSDGYANDNWSLGHRPRTLEEIRFDGAVSNASCENLQQTQDEPWNAETESEPPRFGEGSYDKVRFINGYTGHVSLGHYLTIIPRPHPDIYREMI